MANPAGRRGPLRVLARLLRRQHHPHTPGRLLVGRLGTQGPALGGRVPGGVGPGVGLGTTTLAVRPPWRMLTATRLARMWHDARHGTTPVEGLRPPGHRPADIPVGPRPGARTRTGTRGGGPTPPASGPLTPLGAAPAASGPVAEPGWGVGGPDAGWRRHLRTLPGPGPTVHGPVTVTDLAAGPAPGTLVHAIRGGAAVPGTAHPSDPGGTTAPRRAEDPAPGTLLTRAPSVGGRRPGRPGTSGTPGTSSTPGTTGPTGPTGPGSRPGPGTAAGPRERSGRAAGTGSPTPADTPGGRRAPLGAATATGPEVGSPLPLSDLRVAGGAAVPAPSGGFAVDPVEVSPAPVSPALRERPAVPGGDVDHLPSRAPGALRPGRAAGSPESRRPGRVLGSPASHPPGQRWAEAVRERPLEHPRPFPDALLPWARAVSGRSTPRYTTGPATRAALDAAGAVGASSGDVVHLASAPTGSPRPAATHVIAHELAHLRQPLARPRFLLGIDRGDLDADERRAREFASGVPGIGGSVSLPGPVSSAGLVEDLPVAGTPNPTGLARAAMERYGGLAATGAAGAVTAAAGVPGHLDVPGGLTPAGLASGGFDLTGGATALSRAGGLAAGGSGSPADAADAGPGTGPAPGSAAGPAAAPGGAAAGTNPLAGQAPERLSESVVDRVVDAIEQRVLAEIERRGGRYREVF
ncbi:MAG: DUF4157 domain-containing protein [Actinomycetales bacterium]|nr:DUF4157 domain-containing protein [Actinomycetales bacterium]